MTYQQFKLGKKRDETFGVFFLTFFTMRLGHMLSRNMTTFCLAWERTTANLKLAQKILELFTIFVVGNFTFLYELFSAFVEKKIDW